MHGTPGQMARMANLASRATSGGMAHSQPTVTTPVYNRTMPSSGNRRTLGYSRRYIGGISRVYEPHQSKASHSGPAMA